MPERSRPMNRPPRYDEQIADLRKNARERLRISVHEFNGVDCLSLRVWFDNGNAHRPDEMKPSAKGLTVNVAMLSDIIEALQSAAQKAKELELI